MGHHWPELEPAFEYGSLQGGSGFNQMVEHGRSEYFFRLSNGGFLGLRG